MWKVFFKLEGRPVYQPDLLNYAFKSWKCFVDCAAGWMYTQVYAHFQTRIYWFVFLF